MADGLTVQPGGFRWARVFLLVSCLLLAAVVWLVLEARPPRKELRVELAEEARFVLDRTGSLTRPAPPEEPAFAQMQGTGSVA